ncbi:MAG: hypothetical protein LQ339_000725, partial [Xanthoria mediterranea]
LFDWPSRWGISLMDIRIYLYHDNHPADHFVLKLSCLGYRLVYLFSGYLIILGAFEPFNSAGISYIHKFKWRSDCVDSTRHELDRNTQCFVIGHIAPINELVVFDHNILRWRSFNKQSDNKHPGVCVNDILIHTIIRVFRHVAYHHNFWIDLQSIDCGKSDTLIEHIVSFEHHQQSLDANTFMLRRALSEPVCWPDLCAKPQPEQCTGWCINDSAHQQIWIFAHHYTVIPIDTIPEYRFCHVRSNDKRPQDHSDLHRSLVRERLPESRTRMLHSLSPEHSRKLYNIFRSIIANSSYLKSQSDWKLRSIISDLVYSKSYFTWKFGSFVNYSNCACIDGDMYRAPLCKCLLEPRRLYGVSPEHSCKLYNISWSIIANLVYLKSYFHWELGSSVNNPDCVCIDGDMYRAPLCECLLEPRRLHSLPPEYSASRYKCSNAIYSFLMHWGLLPDIGNDSSHAHEQCHFNTGYSAPDR